MAAEDRATPNRNKHTSPRAHQRRHPLEGDGAHDVAAAQSRGIWVFTWSTSNTGGRGGGKGHFYQRLQVGDGAHGRRRRQAGIASHGFLRSPLSTPTSRADKATVPGGRRRTDLRRGRSLKRKMPSDLMRVPRGHRAPQPSPAVTAPPARPRWTARTRCRRLLRTTQHHRPRSPPRLRDPPQGGATRSSPPPSSAGTRRSGDPLRRRRGRGKGGGSTGGGLGFEPPGSPLRERRGGLGGIRSEFFFGVDLTIFATMR